MARSKLLLVVEYSVDACRTLAMKSPALVSSPTMAAAKGLVAISNLLRAVSVFYASASARTPRLFLSVNLLRPVFTCFVSIRVVCLNFKSYT
jgi:hypothetical protein